MSARRILYLCHGHPALVPGGGETFAHDLFRAFRDAGDPAMFVGCVSRIHRAPRADGAAFQAVGRSGDEMLLWVGGFDRFMFAPLDTGSFVSGLGELIRAFAPDIVHVHHFSLVGLEALAVIRRVRPEAAIVATLHDYHPICANEGLMTTTAGALCRGASNDACHACFPEIAPARFAARKLHLRTMLGRVDRFIAPSRFLRDRFVAWGLPASAIDVIPNAVPASRPAPAGPARSRDRFAFLGNLAPHKGVLAALSAIARIAPATGARLALHGDLVYRDPGFAAQFRLALDAAGAAARHDGPYARGDLPRLLAAADWVVVPSNWWENAPLVILEAFRHRRPVITADIGGMAELVRDGVDGLTFRAGDAADLARVMRRAASERGLWSRLARGITPPPTLADALAAHRALYDSLPAAPQREAA
jgi:glycosyltransferase involved in cell wall biosynthesis